MYNQCPERNFKKYDALSQQNESVFLKCSYSAAQHDVTYFQINLFIVYFKHFSASFQQKTSTVISPNYPNDTMSHDQNGAGRRQITAKTSKTQTQKINLHETTVLSCKSLSQGSSFAAAQCNVICQCTPLANYVKLSIQGATPL